MGEVIVQKLNELQELEPDTHWFCPRSTPRDYGSYFDEDVLKLLAEESGTDKAHRHLKIQEAEERRDAALEACKIFAFDGGDAKGYQEQLKDGLETQLTRCDICVREYHRSRSLLMQTLDAEFDSDEVQEFMRKFDEVNFDRINRGLDSATETLIDLPPAQRNITAIGEVGMYALFGALNCIPFLQNEDVLQQHFDRPFKLVQVNKKIKLPSCAPGMVCFVYSGNEERSAWALRNIGQIKRPLTGTEFEHSVKPFLEIAMSRVNILALEREFLPAFWHGTRLIISKLNQGLIKDHLRTMDSNLYTLALEHFQVDGTHFADLLSSFQNLLELNKDAFWEAMGNITAQAVAETIFRSPTLQQQLKITEEKEPLHLDEKMEWTLTIIRSLKAANLVPPVQTILRQLLKTFQGKEYSRYARSVTWTKGFTCLFTALKTMEENVSSGPLMTNMVQIVAHEYIETIMQELSDVHNKKEMQIDRTEQISLDIIELALKIDINGLWQDRKTILSTKALDHELSVSGLNVWKVSMKQVKSGGPLLATSILSGIADLLKLENFTSRQLQPMLKPAQRWNEALKRAQNFVCDDLLERLDSFGGEFLLDLFQEPKAIQGLIMLLFNGEARVHQATLNVFKAMTSEDDRRGSLMHITQAFYKTAMPSVVSALDKISETKVFGPCSVSMKICSDILSCLCDSEDGVLRRRSLPPNELEILKSFWHKIWDFVGMIFEQTETWSNLGYDKDMLQDFCRETMDFADYAFEQYSIFASTLLGESERSDKNVRRLLLEHPRTKFAHITKWLRLRDEYLISKAVGLTVKILGRLREVGIEISSGAAQYIESIVMSSDRHQKVRTKLSMQQKAELQRALENHLGENLAEVIDADALDKPRKQTNIQNWTSSGRSSGASTPEPRAVKPSRPGTIDVDAWSKANQQRKETHAWEDEEMKKLMGSMGGTEAYKQRALQQQQKKASVSAATSKAAQKAMKDATDFLARRQKEKDEAERRRKAALAKATGVGAGSGVSGLGDIGKDHSLKGQNVMVSSDEGSDGDDDEDELEADLFGTKTKTIKRPNVDPNGAVGLKAEQKMGPTKIQRTVRSSRDMRARLAPDLTTLHRVILKWDFFHNGDYPPGANEHQFREVANSFTDPTTYQDTFQPLLTLEAWQGMVRAREDSSSKPYEVKIQNRTNVDSFIEVSSTVGQAENRELQLQESDIILFSKAKTPTEDGTAPHCLARIYKVKRKKAQLEVVYQVLPGTSLTPSLTAQAVVWGVKVQSITPLEREYGALQALQYYDLCPQIIRARPSKKLHFSEKQISNYQDVWNVNRAQSEAINAALENEGFSLIQGPPGSGKTKTIIAIVGGLLSQSLGQSSAGMKISMPKPNGNQVNGGDAPPKKLLVCAPSNAAVDELVMRLKEGVKTRGGRHHHLNVVRIGRSEAINSQVLDVTMEQLVSKRLGNNENEQKLRERNAELFKEHEKVSARLRDLISRKDSDEIKDKELSSLESDIASVRKQKHTLGTHIDNAKDTERNAGREAELNRKKAQQCVLDEAHVICSTLSGSGHDMFQSLNIEFETVIIDEAAQCVEMSSLIPLKYGCIKCILVGDPKQLPPTVFSKEAAKYQYEQSLFVRMQNNHADEVHLLDTQYRMHPEISVFPSQTFYDGLLKDGKGMAGLRQRPWHASSLLAPYRFFDVAGQHSAAPRGHSLINVAEIDIAISLYDRLISDFQNYDYNGHIGIITPYKSQLKALKERFSARFGKSIVEEVEFNTTDAFQGRESEIIIFSCVRASATGGIGFLQDIRRMNVGLTRAKSSLWVLGNSESLIRGQFWKRLVEDAKARDCYTAGKVKEMLSKPSSAFLAENITTRSMLDVDSHIPQMSASNSTWSASTATNSLLGGTAQNFTPNHNGPPRSGTNEPKAPLDTDRMDGISYRFEDRVLNKSSPSMGLGNGPADDKIGPLDVEMDDANSTGSGSVAPSNTVSRAETPLSGDESVINQADGRVKPRHGYAAPSVTHPLKKRPAPNPFMPRKQHRPKPS